LALSWFDLYAKLDGDPVSRRLGKLELDLSNVFARLDPHLKG
jgi:hypothetical protein